MLTTAFGDGALNLNNSNSNTAVGAAALLKSAISKQARVSYWLPPDCRLMPVEMLFSLAGHRHKRCRTSHS